MKLLLITLSLAVAAFSLIACGGGKTLGKAATPVASTPTETTTTIPTATYTPTVQVTAIATAVHLEPENRETGLCHTPGTLEGGRVYFESDHICLIQYISSGATFAMIDAPEADAYRLLKKQIECIIPTTDINPGYRFFWAPWHKLDLGRDDINTYHPCDNNFRVR